MFQTGLFGTRFRRQRCHPHGTGCHNDGGHQANTKVTLKLFHDQALLVIYRSLR
jgi:hypothetical protein